MLVASRTGSGPPEILHFPSMPLEQRRRLHGNGVHSPIERLTVSQPTTVEFTFQIGETPVERGGKLLVVWRWPFDWGDLQSTTPHAPGYVRWQRERGQGPLQLAIRYQWIAGIEPWHHQLEAKLVAGRLLPGDVVRLICGDQGQGGSGWNAPTCAAKRVHFLMLIDHQGDHRRRRLAPTPSFAVEPGEPQRLFVCAPSDARSDAPFRAIVRAEDCWGNAASLPESVSLTCQNGKGVLIRPLTAPAECPAQHFEVTASRAGELRLRGSAEKSGLTAVSNRVQVAEQQPAFDLFWGDLHSGQTEIGCGAGSLGEHYAFGRDCAGLQFITHQANDHYVTREDWRRTREITNAYDAPGEYVALLGCEWSPLTAAGGDRNVFYRDDEHRLRRSGRFFEEAEPDPEPDVRTAPEFHEAFRDLDVLVNIHVGGRPTNLQWYEPKIERLCEIHSTHGTSEWFVMDALRQGCVVGLTAGTDGVMGRPGACSPGRRLIRNVRNGLTGVYAEQLTRPALWSALQERRCYATTGARIRLWVEVNGRPLGACFDCSQTPRIQLTVGGESPLERIDLLRGVEVLHSWRLSEPAARPADGSLPLRVLWSGTERKGTARLQRVDWDGGLEVSDGRLQFVEPVHFQSHHDQVRQIDDARIRWRSKTAGDSAGVIVRVHDRGDARLHFASGPATFDVSLAEVATREWNFAAGGVGRRVSIGPPPAADGPLDAEFGFVDEQPLAGVQPYWVRVVQVDQERAWSSPVYVNYQPR